MRKWKSIIQKRTTVEFKNHRLWAKIMTGECLPPDTATFDAMCEVQGTKRLAEQSLKFGKMKARSEGLKGSEGFVNWSAMSDAQEKLKMLKFCRHMIAFKTHKPISRQDIHELNNINIGIRRHGNRMEHFPNSIPLLLTDKLVTEKKIGRCKWWRCKKLFKYHEGKKYCTIAADGRNCGKKARARNDYLRNHSRRLSEKIGNKKSYRR